MTPRLIRAPLFPSAAVLWNLELGTWNLELGTWNLELPASAGLALPCLSEACASIEILLENQHLACDRCSRNVRLT